MRPTSLALAACLAALACNDSSTAPAGEAELEVSLTTTGDDPDLDGYVVDVDGRVALPVGANGKVPLQLPAGRHTLELEGVASNCAVGGGRRREIDLPTGATALPIAVACKATGVIVTVRSDGLDLDGDGYRVRVGGGYRAMIAANSTVTVSRLDPGTHLVELTDISGHCEPVGPAAQSVTVVNREITPLAFAVSCGAATAVIRVVVSTTGSDTDSDGYVALLDGRGAISAPVAASSGVGYVTAVPAGTHSVGLIGIAANCAVVGEAAPTAAVTVGGPVRDTAEVDFTVNCAPDRGTIHVTTTVTGDPQGAQFTAYAYCDDYYDYDGDCPDPEPEPVILAPDGTATLTARSGGYYVGLELSSAPCSVTAGQGTMVEITAGSEQEVHFDVACGPPTIRVTAPTTGTNPDTEYTVTLWYNKYWGDPDVPIELGVLAANGTLTAEAPFSGYSWVSLGGVADNCTVQAPNPTDLFYLRRGVTHDVIFPVTCGP